MNANKHHILCEWYQNNISDGMLYWMGRVYIKKCKVDSTLTLNQCDEFQ